MKNRRLNIFFRKRIVRSGYQKAIVATAHKLLQYVSMFGKTKPFTEKNIRFVRNPIFDMAHRKVSRETDWDAVYRMQDIVAPVG